MGQSKITALKKDLQKHQIGVMKKILFPKIKNVKIKQWIGFYGDINCILAAIHEMEKLP